jgi:hypothetical protein
LALVVRAGEQGEQSDAIGRQKQARQRAEDNDCQGACCGHRPWVVGVRLCCLNKSTVLYVFMHSENLFAVQIDVQYIALVPSAVAMQKRARQQAKDEDCADSRGPGRGHTTGLVERRASKVFDKHKVCYFRSKLTSNIKDFNTQQEPWRTRKWSCMRLATTRWRSEWSGAIATCAWRPAR